MSQFLAIFISRKVDSFPSMFYVAFKPVTHPLPFWLHIMALSFSDVRMPFFLHFCKKTFVAKFIAAISWMLVQFQLVQFSMLLYTLWHITRTCKNEHATLDKVPA